MTNCQSCGAKDQNSKFCVHCGIKIVKPAPKPVGRSCSSCGVALTPTQKFCTSCGTKCPLPGAVAAVPKPVVPSCQGCNAVLTATSKFCTSCGMATGVASAANSRTSAASAGSTGNKICKKCNNTFPASKSFCTSCGGNLVAAPTVQSSPSPPAATNSSNSSTISSSSSHRRGSSGFGFSAGGTGKLPGKAMHQLSTAIAASEDNGEEIKQKRAADEALRQQKLAAAEAEKQQKLATAEAEKRRLAEIREKRKQEAAKREQERKEKEQAFLQQQIANRSSSSADTASDKGHRGSSMKGLTSMWDQKTKEADQEQRSNIFSQNYDGSGGLKKGDKGYGTAPEGSASAKRAEKATQWVKEQIVQLIQIIQDLGEGMKPLPYTTFGILFVEYENISDTLVGILQRAKKYGVLTYEGDMLWQGQSDDVQIHLLEAAFTFKAE